MKGIEQPIDVKAGNNNQVEKKKDSILKVEEKYQELCNLNYVRSTEARKELKELIDALWKLEEITMQKISNHDLSVRYKGRQLVKICPLKKGWSASVNGGKVQNYSKDEVLSKVKEQMKSGIKEQSKSSTIQDDKSVIKKLEERITKLSKGNKGISIKGIKITSEIKKWTKEKGYTLTGETLLVN